MLSPLSYILGVASSPVLSPMEESWYYWIDLDVVDLAKGHESFVEIVLISRVEYQDCCYDYRRCWYYYYRSCYQVNCRLCCFFYLLPMIEDCCPYLLSKHALLPIGYLLNFFYPRRSCHSGWRPYLTIRYVLSPLSAAADAAAAAAAAVVVAVPLDAETRKLRLCVISPRCPYCLYPFSWNMHLWTHTHIKAIAMVESARETNIS